MLETYQHIDSDLGTCVQSWQLFGKRARSGSWKVCTSSALKLRRMLLRLCVRSSVCAAAKETDTLPRKPVTSHPKAAAALPPSLRAKQQGLNNLSGLAGKTPAKTLQGSKRTAPEAPRLQRSQGMWSAVWY